MKILPIQLQSIKPVVFTSDERLKIDVPKNDEFARSADSIDVGRIKALDIAHFRLASPNSVRGVTLANKKPYILSELKESGINTIIDLRSSDVSKYEQKCKNAGLDFINFKLKLNMPIFRFIGETKLPFKEREAVNKEFVGNLPKFFELMDNERYYMACELGLHRTDFALTLNYLLNPKEPSSVPMLSHMYFDNETNFTNKYVGAVKTLLRNIDSEDRKLLCIPENFGEIFTSRVAKLRIMNRVK